MSLRVAKKTNTYSSLTKQVHVICRTCLKVNKKIFNIFEYRKNNKLIADMLRDFTTVKVQIDDGLPRNMCNSCLNKLSVAFTFKTMAIKCDIELRKIRENNIQIRNETDVDTVKEEDLTCKNEQINLLSASHENFDAEYNTQESISKKHIIFKVNSEEYKGSELDLTGVFNENECIEQIDVKETEITQESLPYVANCLSDSISNSFKQSLTDNQQINLNKKNNDLMLTNNLSNHTYDVNNCEIKSNISISSLSLEREEQINSSEDNLKIHLLDIASEENMDTNLSRRKQYGRKIFCKICEKSYSFQYYIGIHSNQHRGNLPYKCDICGKGYVLNSQLRIHKRTHSDNRPHLCGKCGKGFKSCGALQAHSVKHSDERPYKCNVCNKAFKLPGSLRLHARRHNGEKSDVCEICGKSFNDRSALLRHMGNHNTNQNFTCPVCNKIFITKLNLNTHLKRHSNKRPFACDYCDKSFTRKGTLQSHILIHTGEKPYSCKICGKSFRQRGVIAGHMRVHTGETPYQCNLCSSKFQHKHYLINHLKKHQKS